MRHKNALRSPVPTFDTPFDRRNVAAPHRDLKLAIEYVPVGSLKAYHRALREHSQEHIEQLKASIEAFGLVLPILINAGNEIVAGHGIYEAARKAGIDAIPVVRLSHLNGVEERILRIGLNRLGENSKWTPDLLAIELEELHALEVSMEVTVDLTITGFPPGEIDQLIESRSAQSESDTDDLLPDASSGQPVSQLGDLWNLGEHRLICGDARDKGIYDKLLEDQRAAMGIHDGPYDVPISGHVAKRGRHREFVMGSGELGKSFAPFLTAFLQASTAYTVPGGYQYCFMDWRHMGEMLCAGAAAGLELKNLCVWNKGSSGQGSFYRSQHELVFVFRDPNGPAANHVQLGRFGRSRSNIWNYPGSATMRKELELHPTPKNVRMIADAIRDVTRRNDIVLDCFSGSGTTIIAAAKVGRRGYAIELDPLYVDIGVRRWEQWSGNVARHAETGLTFAEMADKRRNTPDPQVSRPIVRVRRRVTPTT